MNLTRFIRALFPAPTPIADPCCLDGCQECDVEALVQAARAEDQARRDLARWEGELA